MSATPPNQQITPVVSFMTRMYRLDKLKIGPMDLLIMWTIKTHPGLAGIELARKLGRSHRSSVQNAIGRLQREGYIEDRRCTDNLLTPNYLFSTAKCDELLAEMIPQ